MLGPMSKLQYCCKSCPVFADVEHIRDGYDKEGCETDGHDDYVDDSDFGRSSVTFDFDMSFYLLSI